MASIRSSKNPPAQNLTSGPERYFGSLREVQEIIDGLVEQIALIGRDGTILAVNESWRRQVERQARTGLHISRDYLRFLTDLIEDGDEGAVAILEAFNEISAGVRQTSRCIYKGSGVFAGYDFDVRIAALTVQETRYVLVSVHDVTELVTLKRQRRRLGSQLLRAQENERRRMARELHDSTSQMLVVLQLQLSRAAKNCGAECDPIIAECREAVQEIQREIRTFSFLAHPPSLIGNDLALALESLVRGFADRTGLRIDFDVLEPGEVSASIEAAIYRLAQEALANIYRHAKAGHATVWLVGRVRYLHLMIRDDGIGFDAAAPDHRHPLGVGLTGMRERVRELGGRLSIQRADKGTAITVSLPRQKRMRFAPQIGGR